MSVIAHERRALTRPILVSAGSSHLNGKCGGASISFKLFQIDDAQR